MVNAWSVCAEDDVVVILQDVAAGEMIDTGRTAFLAAQDIPQGHKAAVRDIAAGEMVKKYGVPIGQASCTIRCGEHVHCHNLKDVTEELCRTYAARFMEGGAAK